MTKTELDDEANSPAFKKGLKRYREGRDIRCSYCPYHKGENTTRDNRHKTWKNRKIRKQWMKKP